MVKKLPKKRSPNALRWVTIKKSSRYGPPLYGLKIYHPGKKPSGLGKDGQFRFGKHTLEILQQKFGENFRLVLTPNEDSVTVKGDVNWIRISQSTLSRMYGISVERGRDMKIDIVSHVLALIFPSHFTTDTSKPYVPGALARLLYGVDVTKMSDKDKEAIKAILPDFIASESLKSVNLLKAATQIKSLRELETELREALAESRSEAWWQNYIKERILVIQQGYIQTISGLNVVLGGTKFPDFILVTHDNYIDILEIKKPDTKLLKHDSGRDNYHWTPEMTKAVIQTENYIAEVERSRDAIRSHLKDKHGLELQVLRPRGIILAGKGDQLGPQKEKDDFRLLYQGMKHITVITYDELLTRLSNYIHVLEAHVAKPKPRKKIKNAS